VKLKHALFSGISILLIFALSGCTVKQVKKVFHETSYLEMKIQAATDLNPNRKGRPSPLVIYIYELSDAAPFNEADFFAIYDNEAETIGAVLLSKIDVEISPGETREITRTLKASTRHLGILAAYRDIDNAKWRASRAIPEHSKIELKLNVDQLSISLIEN